MSASCIITGNVAYERVCWNGIVTGYYVAGSAIYAYLAASVSTAPRLIGDIGADLDMQALDGLVDTADARRLNIVSDKNTRIRLEYNGDMSRCNISVEEWGQLAARRNAQDFPKEADVLLLCSDDPDYSLAVMQKCTAALTVWNGNFRWFEVRPVSIRSLISRANIIVLNDHEYSRLATGGREDCIWVITHGSKGITLREGVNTAVVESPKMAEGEVLNASGAGDVVAGCIAGGLAASGALSKSCAAPKIRADLAGIAKILRDGSEIIRCKLKAKTALDFRSHLRALATV